VVPSFTGQSPDLVLGSAIDTPDVHGVAVADLDGDGDLDLATANTGDGTISLFPQLAPAVFGSQVGQRLGGGASTAGTNAVVAADWNGDGRVDLVAANRTGKTVTGFAQQGDGTFAAAASFTLGAGSLGDPFHLACADLDKDGDLDLAVADASANRIQLFHRNAGAYPAAPDATLGSNATTKSPVFVLAADLNGDGAADLACANSAGNNVTVFFQQPGGTFSALPNATLGSNGTTNGPVVVAAADLDGDGDVDLVVQRSNEPTLVVENLGAPKNSWVEVALSDGSGRNRFGVGARVEISAAGRRQVRQVTCGDSYCSQRPLTLHFGLGAGELATVEVKVRWPDGTAQRFPDVKPRQRVVLRREEGKAQ
jgi:hypothetical protein